MSVAINRPYGELYRYDDNTVLQLTNLGEWYPTQCLLQGLCLGLKYENGTTDCHLVVPTGMQGIYKIDWVSSAAGETGKTYEIGISVNGTMVNRSIVRRKMGSSDIGSMAGNCIIYVPPAGTVKLNVRCIDFAGVTLTLKHTNLSVVKV